jgi:hypothetical protein
MGTVLPLAHQRRNAGPQAYQYRGIFHTEDSNQYFSYPLIIPSGTQQVVIDLAYTSNNGSNVLGLQVFDRNGFRGRGRSLEAERDWHRVAVVIAAGCRTKGAVSGEIAPGVWTIEIDTYSIKNCCAFELETAIYRGRPVPEPGGELEQDLPLQLPYTQRPGWYRGDLHVHSDESDGALDARDLLRLAVIRGLDFLAITDHNVHTAWQQFTPGLPEFCLPLNGIELSTYYGHGNALGVSEWVDWRIGLGKYGVNEMIRQVQELGGIFSINHPRTGKLPQDHACWRAEEVDYSLVGAVEIWNAPVYSNGTGANQQSRRFWDQLLNQGYRITGIGGSDAHYLEGSRQPLGIPLTYVYARSLSQTGIITGIKRGNVFMTAGPIVDFTATTNSGAKAMVGEELLLSKRQELIWLQVNVKDAPVGSSVRLVKNGEPWMSEAVSHDGLFSIAWCDKDALGKPDGLTWYRVEVYAPEQANSPGGDGLLAITNPIYCTATVSWIA